MTTTAVKNKRLAQMRDQGCSQCGYNGIALQWDHLEPSTKHERLKQNKSMSVIRMPEYLYHDEIAKCRILCANCHSEHTYNQQIGNV